MRKNMGLYRAKRKDNKKWIKGYLYRISEHLNPFIMLKNKYAESHEVDPKTVGQYTGCCDYIGRYAYEHDIVWDGINERYGVIAFLDGEFIVIFDGLIEAERFDDIISSCCIEGNIFDNSELLNGGEGE